MAKSKERKITQWELEQQAKVLDALNLTEADLTDLMVVPAKIRFVRVVCPTSRLGAWEDRGLCLQIYEAPKQGKKLITCISIDGENWADYSLDEFDDRDFTFMAEDYLMQIDYKGRVPDEILERQQAQEIVAMEQHVSNFLNKITGQQPPADLSLEQAADNFFGEF